MKDGKLEACDLMIGDWVNYRGIDIQVTSLYDKGGSNEIGWGDKESTWVNGCSIEPIPLTPEILEKNGFRLIDDSYYYSDGDNVVLTKNYGNYPGEHKFDWVKHTKGINKRGQYANIDYYIATIDYVHQLQHALKLCGIEKEIVL